MSSWVENAIFYHIYPFGCLGCEKFQSEVVHHRILELKSWIPHLQKLHVNAVYLGPVFSSYEHGYDTSDYQKIDRRLGTNEEFKELCDALHEANIKIVLDGVFNHVGRSFWAFQDVQNNLQRSSYCTWFHNLNFHAQSPLQDSFTYDAWEGHYNLVKLNLANEDVVNYLLESIGMWMDVFRIDGLRLDAADCIRPQFFKRLKSFCTQKQPDFWLMGEIIHGDYTRWANPEMLDSVTNYECYKGLYSSHNEKNYFEIAHSLQRQFSDGGIYKHLNLYNFVDNHDVNRLASVLKTEEDIYNIYTLLYTIPGIPSLYYGSEYACKGTKHHGSDADIRPRLNIQQLCDISLTHHLYTLGELYQKHPALRKGSYQQVLVRNEQFVFTRADQKESLYVACNLSNQSSEISITVAFENYIELFSNTTYSTHNEKLSFEIPAHRSMIFTQTDQKVEMKKANKKLSPALNEFEYVKNEIKIGKYRHFKGKEYAVLYTAKHSETLEEYVVYRQLYGECSVWIRPASMFCEILERDGKQIPRFTYIGM